MNFSKSWKTSAAYVDFLTHHQEFASFSEFAALILCGYENKGNCNIFSGVSTCTILFLLINISLKIGAIPFN